MSKKIVPTLSLDGYVQDENVMMSKIYEYFLLTQYSQSYLYGGYIESYDKSIKATTALGSEVEAALENSLYRLYDKYFTDVEPTVKLEDEDGLYKLTIDVSCVGANGDKLYLSKAMTITDGKINEIAGILDYFNS